VGRQGALSLKRRGSQRVLHGVCKQARKEQAVVTLLYKQL
jgi:hypothetical protein